MTIAITGATGQLGRLAIAALKTRAPQAEVVALARDPVKAADLGLPVRPFDYHNPETLAPALEGVATLVVISSSDFNDRAGQHARVIEAARAAGVDRVIYTSILKGDASPMIIAADHAATEATLKASGLGYTILRNGWYTENYIGSALGGIAHGGMAGAAGEGRISTAARADYAEAIAVVAADDGHANRIYELAGDSAFTMAEMAAEVSRLTGKSIGYANLPQAEYAKVLEGVGLPAPVAAIFADSDARAGEGALFDDSCTLSRLIGRPTTPMAATLAAALA